MALQHATPSAELAPGVSCQGPTPFSLCEKIALFRSVAEVGQHWELLAKQLPGRQRATVREFYKSYERKAAPVIILSFLLAEQH